MRYSVCCVALMLLLVLQVNGQKGNTIMGKVSDEAKAPIPFVSVHLLNTLLSATGDKEGNFKIENMAAGRYTIELSAIGFASMVTQIEVGENNNSIINFQLANTLVQLEDVIVTAEKKEESLQKIPVSITAVSASQVQDYRLWNAKDLTAIVPNLYAGNSGDQRNVTSIRGITTTSYDPAVATYVDGVNQFSLDTYIPQLSDIERIEILRGPQGTLYGRNAMAGVINIITKKPTNTTSGFAEINVGNYNQLRYSAGIRTALIKNKLFFGASGTFDKRNGFYTNDFNNSSFDKQQALTGNYYLKYLPTHNWSVILNVKHQNNQNNGAFPMVVGVDKALSNPFHLKQNAIGKMMDNSLNSSLSIRHTGAVNFESQTAFQNNHRIYKNPIDGDFSQLDAVTVINDYGKQWNNVKVFTQEFRLSSSAIKTSKFSWTAGAYFFHQYNPVKQATHFGKDAGLLGIPDINFSSINITKGKNTGASVYGQAEYLLTKNLSVIAGLRYDYEHKYLTARGEFKKDGQPVFVTLPDTAASANFSALSPKLGLKWQVAKSSNVYANYSRGFRTGGLTQLSSDPSEPPLYPYQPEYSNNIELGIKNNFFNDRLRVNAVVFYTQVNNAQVPTLVLPDAITVTRNTGRLTSKGAELELAVKPFKGLQLDYSFGYTDSKYKSLKVSGNGQAVNLDGKKQIFTPDVTSMLALQYSYTLLKKQAIKLVARGEWMYLGEQYFDLANNIRQPSYNLLNTRIGVSSKHVDLFFWMRNITNKNYIEYGYDFGAVHLGNPKTYGITIRMVF